MKRYIKVKSHYSNSYTTKRMVNQLEIVDYLKNNPHKTETQIMSDLYGFHRGGFESNIKYANCLRRALHSGKISRLSRNVGRSKFLYYVPKPEPKYTFMEWLTKG